MAFNNKPKLKDTTAVSEFVHSSPTEVPVSKSNSNPPKTDEPFSATNEIAPETVNPPIPEENKPKETSKENQPTYILKFPNKEMHFNTKVAALREKKSLRTFILDLIEKELKRTK